MKHILLTGATGFLGSHLLEALLMQGYKVTILKRSTSDTWRIDHLLGQVRAFDVDQVEVDEAFKAYKFDVVIHTACSYGRKKESTSSIISTNLIFGIRLLEAAIENKVKLFINTDTFFSGKVVSNHLFDYSLSKKQFNEWLKNKVYNLSVVNLRLQHMYGPKDNPNKFVPWLVDSILNVNGRIQLTSGEQQRDFIYVGDVVSAYMVIIKAFFGSRGYFELDVGSGDKISIKEFVQSVYNHINQRAQIRSSLGFGDLKDPNNEIDEINCDVSRLKTLGWIPAYSIDGGILDMLSKEGY